MAMRRKSGKNDVLCSVYIGEQSYQAQNNTTEISPFIDDSGEYRPYKQYSRWEVAWLRVHDTGSVEAAVWIRDGKHLGAQVAPLPGSLGRTMMLIQCFIVTLKKDFLL